MIRYITGNILESNAEALVNTVGVMGKGIALQFKKAFPSNFKAYEEACKNGELNIGKLFVTRDSNLLRTIALVFISTLIACSCQVRSNKLNEKDFTLLFKDSLEKRLPDASFQLNDDLSIKANYGEENQNLYLDNAYRAYENSPDSISSIISQYVTAAVSSFKMKKQIDKSLIVPVVKPMKYLDDLSSLDHGGTSLDRLIFHEKYNDDLIIVYAEDSEHNIRFLNKVDIDTLKIGQDTLRNFAFNNLRKILPDVEIVGGEGNFGIIAGGTFETSLILSNTMWNKTNFPVDGDIVIAMPTRGMVFITGSNNKEQVKKLKDRTEEGFENENYQASPYLFRYNGERFERLN